VTLRLPDARETRAVKFIVEIAQKVSCYQFRRRTVSTRGCRYLR